MGRRKYYYEIAITAFTTTDEQWQTNFTITAYQYRGTRTTPHIKSKNVKAYKKHFEPNAWVLPQCRFSIPVFMLSWSWNSSFPTCAMAPEKTWRSTAWGLPEWRVMIFWKNGQNGGEGFRRQEPYRIPSLIPIHIWGQDIADFDVLVAVWVLRTFR